MFFDPFSATGDDPDHSLEERRLVTFGMSASGRLLVVAHVHHEDVIRIITARLATPAERMLMRKAKAVATDELRRGYKRSDFGGWSAGSTLSGSERVPTLW